MNDKGYPTDNEIREENTKLLKIFEDDLNGLSNKTVANHLSNVDLFLNDFLLRWNADTYIEGMHQLDFFIEGFFIPKCMWSTPTSVKSTVTSIKKFYKSMYEHNIIDKNSYMSLCEEIKENLSDWQEYCHRYNNFDCEDDDFFEL